MTVKMTSESELDPVSLVASGKILYSRTSSYQVLRFLGEGIFGKVVQCLNLNTCQTVAVKILNKDDRVRLDTEREVAMLNYISDLIPDNNNMVKFFEKFEYQGQTCLVFEMLSMDLYGLLQQQDFSPLSLNEIRAIAAQLFTALQALSSIGVLHTDIKPDNIMLIDEPGKPRQVRLIDFGLALKTSETSHGMLLQPTGYRAPEIALGTQFSETIDTWGAGCVLAFLYLANNLFNVECDYHMIKTMVNILGMPNDHQLRTGIYSPQFFCKNETSDGPRWSLLTADAFEAINKFKALNVNYEHQLTSLEDLVDYYPEGCQADMEDRRVFVDFLKGLLHLDGDKRLSAHQALQHPFITMTHLQKPDSMPYLKAAQTFMSCENKQSSKEQGPNVGQPEGPRSQDSWEEYSLSGPSADKSSNFLSCEKADTQDPAVNSTASRSLKQRIKQFFRRIAARFCC